METRLKPCLHFYFDFCRRTRSFCLSTARLQTKALSAYVVERVGEMDAPLFALQPQRLQLHFQFHQPAPLRVAEAESRGAGIDAQLLAGKQLDTVDDVLVGHGEAPRKWGVGLPSRKKNSIPPLHFPT